LNRCRSRRPKGLAIPSPETIARAEPTDSPIYPLVAEGVAELIPSEYRSYEPAIAEALAYFLARLHPSAQQTIQRSFRDLDSSVSATAALVTVMRHCPTLHKLGQVLARDRRLAPEVRAHLQELEAFDATLPVADLERLVRESLGDAVAEYDIVPTPERALEASVAYVVPATWIRPGAGRRERAMLKILKPGLKEQLRSELDTLSGVAKLLDNRCEHYALAPIEFHETFEAVRALLEEESDFESELRNLEEAWAVYRANSNVQVPRPLPFSNERCLAMRFVPGVKITQSIEELPRAQRRALAVRLGKAMLCDALFSAKDTTIVHGDPHAGNLLRCSDGRIGILDWSLVGRLERSDREALLLVLVGAASLSSRKVRDGLALLGLRIEPGSAASEVVSESLSMVVRGRRPGVGWLLGVFDALLKAGVVFPAQLAMLRKNLFTIKGVLADIDPGYSLEREFAKQAAYWFAREWPRRVRRWPFARDYALPIATTDIVEVYAKLPLTLARWIRKPGQSPAVDGR